MKKLLPLIIVFITIFVACKPPQPAQQITGTFKNAKFKKFYLSYNNNTDTLYTDENGNFSFQSSLKEPIFYNLYFHQQDYITLLVDSGEIVNIQGNVSQLADNYTVQGSVGSESIASFYKKLNATRIEIQELGNVLRAQDGEIAVRDSLNKVREKLVEGLRQYSLDILTKHKTSPLQLLVISQQIMPQEYLFDPYNDFSVYKQVSESLVKNYPREPYVLAFQKYYKKLEGEMANYANTRIGATAPEITGKSPKGKEYSLSKFKGKYVLLDFWAGWCRPCRAENPTLVENYRKYARYGFTVFQVSLDKDNSVWETAIRDDKLGRWIHVSDLKYWDSDFAHLYNVKSIPANFLLDKEGKIIAKNLRGPALGQKLASIFGK